MGASVGGQRGTVRGRSGHLLPNNGVSLPERQNRRATPFMTRLFVLPTWAGPGVKIRNTVDWQTARRVW